MKRLTKVLAATAVTVGSIGAFGSAASAGTTVGNDSVDVTITVYGGDADAVMAGLTFELYEGGVLVDPLTCGTAIPSLLVDPLYEQENFACTPGFGTYQVGLDGVPPQYNVSAFCQDGDPIQIPQEILDPPPPSVPTFTLASDQLAATCSISVVAPTLAIDKIIDGGTATVDDFEFEVYDDGGTIVDLPTLVDPDPATCVGDPAKCALVGLAAGNYTIGEVTPDYGYAVTNVSCENRYVGQLNDAIDLPGADFTIGIEADVYCAVTNTYQEGRLVVTASVTNDDGGTATPADVSIEVFQRPSGTEVIAATPCLADGSCLDEMLPIGDYVIGYTGPDGYTREITQTVTADTPLEIVTDDTDAEFTAAYQQTVEIEVLLDDPAPPTTTTTTTVAPTTTLAPTTSLDAGSATLPPTGTSSSTNTAIAAVAALFVLLGGAMIAVRRRDT